MTSWLRYVPIPPQGISDWLVDGVYPALRACIEFVVGLALLAGLLFVPVYLVLHVLKWVWALP
jgi:hypothetical protein